MIRPALVEDWPEFYSLGERLVLKSPYAHIPIDRESALKAYGNCIASAMGFAMVAETEKGLTGALLGVAAPLWWSRSRYATDLMFYSEDGRSGLQLIRAFVAWAEGIPAVRDITMAQSSGINIEKAAVLYERCGFRKVGNIWTK